MVISMSLIAGFRSHSGRQRKGHWTGWSPPEVLAYRIAHKIYSAKLLASGLAGRWSGNGRKVIYCAESIASAVLENMVRRQGVGFNDDFKTMILNIPDDLGIQIVTPKQLPAGWRNITDY